MIFACIPARGGSVGVPRKNMKSLWGRPLIYWALRAALDSKADMVCVSTDNNYIASYARCYANQNARPNSMVVIRPDAISGGEVSSELAVNYTMINYPFPDRNIPHMGIRHVQDNPRVPALPRF